jgi:hypothetical protein
MDVFWIGSVVCLSVSGQAQQTEDPVEPTTTASSDETNLSSEE